MATDLENVQKSSNGHKWPWTSFISAILVSIISAAIIQIGIVSRWIGVTDAKIAVLDDLIKETRLHLSQIDAAGTRTIPVINEKIIGLERSDATKETRINIISTRLDDLINQINRLDTPLSKKVDGIAGSMVTMRDSVNNLTITYISKFETLNKLIDQESLLRSSETQAMKIKSESHESRLAYMERQFETTRWNK
jgi:hypothetical protein